MRKNNWIKLKPLLNEINQVLEEINDFNNKNTSLIVKDISLDLPCYIKKSDDSDFQIQIPDPSDIHNNSKILSKFRFNCDMLPLKVYNKKDESSETFTQNTPEEVEEVIQEAEENTTTNDAKKQKNIDDEFLFNYDVDEENSEEQENKDTKGNDIYTKTTGKRKEYNTNSQDDTGEIDMNYYLRKDYKYSTTLFNKEDE